MLGELVPVGGGDPIPLLKKKLLVGRREGCDVVLRFANVSAHHCQLSLEQGYWFVKDLKSRNGTKVNGARVARKRIDPGDELSVAKHKYRMMYSPVELGAAGPPPPDEEEISEILNRSLLDRAGLSRRRPVDATELDERYDLLDDSAGQIPDPNAPL
jgi:predicted component of type VI protein secretion system